MAEYKDDEYQFPDEVSETKDELSVEVAEDEEVQIEVVDNTPPDDRNVTPLSEDVREELEKADTSADYSHNVKVKFKQYKKAWHDERRAKETAFREQQEALAVAQQMLDENRRLKGMIANGEKELINTYQSSAEMEVDKAKRNYKEAYDTGDSEGLLEAQQELIRAQLKLDRAKNFKPTVQEPNNQVQQQQKQVAEQPQMDPKVASWVSNNQWFVDPSKVRMRRYAEGVHEELESRYGRAFVGTDEYFKAIDQEVRSVFPQEFGGTQNAEAGRPATRTKPSTVVAPAKRSTAPKKVVLSREQMGVIKKLGITPEAYAREFLKLEA